MADEHKVLLAGADERDLTQLAEYQAIGGYRGVAKARAMTPDDLIAELSQANLRGRGGAGFPLGRKASLIDRKSPKPKYLVVNADESEPGAFKDREVMARVPHRLLEGCLIAAHAIESTDVFIYIRGEYLTEYEILAAAVEEAREAGILGEVRIKPSLLPLSAMIASFDGCRERAGRRSIACAHQWTARRFFTPPETA